MTCTCMLDSKDVDVHAYMVMGEPEKSTLVILCFFHDNYFFFNLLINV
jgi:hypothetical protein